MESVIGYVVAFYAFAIGVRAILNYFKGEKTLAEIADKRGFLGEEQSAAIKVVLLLPMLREQSEAVELLYRMDQLDYPPDRILLVPITTEREVAELGVRIDAAERIINDLESGGPGMISRWRYSRYFSGELIDKVQNEGAGPSGDSRTKVREIIAGPSTKDVVHDHLTTWNPRCQVIHLHYPKTSGNKAKQMNFALTTLRETGILCPDEATYVGVYDADSVPDPHTLRALSTYAHDNRPVAFQQYPIYLRNCGKLGRLMRNEAILQTAHSVCVEYPRQHRVNSAIQAGRSAGPTFTYCIGHGVFFRSDWILEVGFPETAPVEDLPLGFMLSLGKKQIWTLPLFDVCTVPSSTHAFVRQTATWFEAQLEFREVIRSAYKHFGRVPTLRIARGLIEQTLTNAKWLLAGPCRVIAVIAAMVVGSWIGLLALLSACLLEARLEWRVTSHLVSRLAGGIMPSFDWLAVVRTVLKSCGPCLVIAQRLCGLTPIRSKTERV
jgi:cellulose synthase/poly-beta-1,6-N-acetylglucosamine synthase-like glycosyltransferase